MIKIKNVQNRITDNEIEKAYNQFQRYLLELTIYEEYTKGNNKVGKVNMFRLLSLYKKKGIEIEDKKDLRKRFEDFSLKIEKIKQENPNIDLKDIRTQNGRDIVSDVISETQHDKKFLPANLDGVAVIENFALYVAIAQLNEKSKNKEEVLKEYDITEKELEKAQESYKKYEKSGMIDIYNNMYQKNKGKVPNRIVHYTAGCLELRPSEARRSLGEIGVLKGSDKKTSNRDINFCYVYEVSKIVIDNIMRDKKLTPEEKNKKICELELAEYERVLKKVEEANEKQNTDRYRILKESDNREIS